MLLILDDEFVYVIIDLMKKNSIIGLINCGFVIEFYQYGLVDNE